MRIAIIGSGGVGCFYGTRLIRAGHDVHFLMRSDLEAVRANGLQVISPDGDFRGPVQAYASSDEIGHAELVICSLKATALDVARDLTAPCVGPVSRVLVLMNGLGIEQSFAARFGPERVFGGMAFVCINRLSPGVVRHIAYGRLSIGHYQDDLTEAERIAELFRGAGVEVTVPPSLNAARWEKLAWNIPFSTLSVTAGAISTKQILDDPGLRGVCRALMAETIAAANAAGCKFEADALIEKMFTNTATMGHYRPSMLVDYDQKRPLEVDAILGEPVRRAKDAGIDVPHLEMNLHLLAMLDRLNRGEVHR